MTRLFMNDARVFYKVFYEEREYALSLFSFPLAKAHDPVYFDFLQNYVEGSIVL